MTVYDLNRDQLAELKVNYYTRGGAVDISYDDIINIDDLVSDQEIFDEYAGTIFSPEDFSSSSDEEYEDTCRVVIEGANKHDITYDLQYIAEQIDNGYSHGILSDGATWYIE